MQGFRICIARARCARQKPLWAVADGMSASAGYLGGSAADRLYVTGTGYAGSIGVVMRHVDVSGAMAQDGIRVTHIYAGDHKIDGNQFEPLPAAVRADFRRDRRAVCRFRAGGGQATRHVCRGRDRHPGANLPRAPLPYLPASPMAYRPPTRSSPSSPVCAVKNHRASRPQHRQPQRS